MVALLLQLLAGLTSALAMPSIRTVRVGVSAAADAATIAGGVALVPPMQSQRWTVEVEPGTYRERVWVNASMGPLTLIGMARPNDTLLVYHCCYRGDGTPRCSNATADRSCAPLHTGAGTGPNRVTSRTGTLLVEAADFMALSISVANDACGYDSRRAEQSQAVQLLADRAAFRHTRLLGAQDTIFAGGETPGDRQYFLQSYINGSCDSIYGTSSIVFDQCEIAITGHVTAMKGAELALSDRPDRGGRASVVFFNSSLVKPVEGQRGYPAKDGGTDLGRPWSFVVYPNGSSVGGGHSLAAVVYHTCFMDSHIAKIGWSDWGNGCSRGADGGKGCTARLDAAGKVQAGNPSCWCENVTYIEQGSYGPGASPATRVKWSHQITEKDAHPGGILGALGLQGTTPRSAMGSWVPSWPTPLQQPVRLKSDDAKWHQPPQLYVSPTGTAAGPGTTPSKPFATIAQARDALRNMQSSAGPQSTVGAIVRVAAGEYFTGVDSIFFDGRDGGVSYVGSSVAGGGQQVEDADSVVYGGSRLTGWTRWNSSGNIWRAPWSGPRFFSLTEGRRVATMAREPDPGSGYLRVSSVSPELAWDDGALPAQFSCDEKDQCGVYFLLNYFSETHSVVSVNLTTRSLKYAAARKVGDTDSARYTGGAWLQGAVQFITTGGEWALAGGYVYYMPIAEHADPNTLTIVACSSPRLLEVVGTSGVAADAAKFAGLSFTNLTLVGSGFSANFFLPPDPAGGNGSVPYQSNFLQKAEQQGMVYIENATGVTVEGCRLLAAGHSAVWIQGWAQQHQISKNWIEQAGFHGIMVQSTCQPSSKEDRRRRSQRRRLGSKSEETVSIDTTPNCGFNEYSSPEEAYVSHHNVLVDNMIKDVGYTVGWGAGIYIYESGENQIVHNTISRTPRDGIGLFAAELPFGQVLNGVTTTFETSFELARTRGNIVAFNDISQTNADTADTGEIEMYGVGGGNMITDNVLHDVYDANGMHSVLFADDWCPNTTFARNTIFWVSLAGGSDCDLFMIKSLNSTVTANVFADSAAHQVGSLSTYEFPAANGMVLQNIHFNLSLGPVSAKTNAQPPYDLRFPANATTLQVNHENHPGCPFNWSAPERNGRCGWSFPLGPGGFDLPPGLLNAPVVRLVDKNFYAGYDPAAFTAQCGPWHGESYDCTGQTEAQWEANSVTTAPANAANAADTFGSGRAVWHERTSADYQVQTGSAAAKATGLSAAELPKPAMAGVRPSRSRFGRDVCGAVPILAPFGGDTFPSRLQAERFDRMSPTGLYRLRSVGIGPGSGAPVLVPSVGGAGGHVTDGAWARFDAVDFGRTPRALANLSARVAGPGVGKLWWVAGSMTPGSMTPLLGTLDVGHPPAGNPWRVLSGKPTAIKLSGVHQVYLVFKASEVNGTGPPTGVVNASSCTSPHCSIHNQTCPPTAPGSIALGFRCCGTGVVGNWCPTMAECGPAPRGQNGTKWPPHDFGSKCGNKAGPPDLPSNGGSAPDISVDYFSF